MAQRYKALSIVAPGGQWIAAGKKTIEVRSWKPEISPDEDLLIVENDRFLHKDGDVDAKGRVLALVRVAHVREFRPEDMQAACASEFAPGYYAWELVNVRPMSSLQFVPAARGIYQVEIG